MKFDDHTCQVTAMLKDMGNYIVLRPFNVYLQKDALPTGSSAEHLFNRDIRLINFRWHYPPDEMMHRSEVLDGFAQYLHGMTWRGSENCCFYDSLCCPQNN